jgi:hypothetical protein
VAVFVDVATPNISSIKTRRQRSSAERAEEILGLMASRPKELSMRPQFGGGQARSATSS